MKNFKFNTIQTAALVAIMTFATKPIGFIREMLMANYFGTSHVTDAYVMAQSIPLVLFGAIFGAVSIVYMPILSSTIELQGEEKGNRFTSSIINLLAILAAIASAIGIIFSDQLVTFFASGFEGETARLTAFYLKICFVTVFISSTTGIVEDFLKYKGSFLIPIISGYPVNIFLILFVFVGAKISAEYLVYGLLLGTISKFILDIFFAKQNGFKYYFNFNYNNAIKKVISLSYPIFISSLVAQVAVFINKTLASGLKVGSVAALNYSNLLILMIGGLTTGILTTMAYPKVTKAATLKDYTKMNDILSKGVTLTAIISFPVTLGSMLYSTQLIQVIFERGAFDHISTNMTAEAFFFYSISFFFTAFNGLQMQCFYSMHDTKTPLLLTLAGIGLDIVLNITLVKHLAHGGLALATSIGAIAMSVVAQTALRKKYPQIKMIKSKSRLLKISLAAVLSVASSWIVYNIVGVPINNLFLEQAFELGLAVVTAGVIYYFLLKRMKIQEIKLIKSIFSR